METIIIIQNRKALIIELKHSASAFKSERKKPFKVDKWKGECKVREIASLAAICRFFRGTAEIEPSKASLNRRHCLFCINNLLPSCRKP